MVGHAGQSDPTCLSRVASESARAPSRASHDPDVPFDSAIAKHPEGIDAPPVHPPQSQLWLSLETLGASLISKP